MAWLIHGVYFQNQERNDFVPHPTEVEVLAVRSGLLGIMYAGIIRQDPEGKPGELIGMMEDRIGKSVLSGIIISDQRVEFVKQYEKTHRIRVPISYVFRMRDGNTWIGEYSGSKAGSGVTRCVLTEVEEKFLDPEPLVKLLSRNDAHFWWPRERRSRAGV